jgi:Domain of unknown function (DUF4926)
MAQAREPKLLDLVAVLSCAGHSDLEVGDVGTVVEVLPPDGLEVEFLDRDGGTRCVATLTKNNVLVLNRERTRVACWRKGVRPLNWVGSAFWTASGAKG